MFDIGWTELLVIAVVAILVVGPKDLPNMLRTLGRYAGKLRRTAGEFRDQFDEAMRESDLDDLRSTISEVDKYNPVSRVRNAVTESLNPLKDAAEDMTSDIGDLSGGSGGSDTATVAKPRPRAPAGTKAPPATKATRTPAARPAKTAKTASKPGASPAKARVTRRKAAAKTDPSGQGD